MCSLYVLNSFKCNIALGKQYEFNINVLRTDVRLKIDFRFPFKIA